MTKWNSDTLGMVRVLSEGVDATDNAAINAELRRTNVVMQPCGDDAIDCPSGHDCGHFPYDEQNPAVEPIIEHMAKVHACA